jgi:uncharacterized protein YbaA (DUF1428 family)
MSYVDGFLIPVPKKNVRAYRRMATMGLKAWMKHGALDYKECVGDDLAPTFGVPFSRLLKLKPNETAIFAFIVFKSRAHRDQVNKKVMQDMGDVPKDMPFDMKRMVYGGFKTLVE